MIPSALTIAAGTSSGRCSAASETKCAPSAKSAWTARAASTASRVLPTPPGPVSVSSRTDPARSRSPTATMSCSRPIVRLGGTGNLRLLSALAVAGRGCASSVSRPSLDGRRELGGVLQDVLVQLAQRLCGLDAELVDEPSARGLEGRQRVGLPSAAIERQHLQLHQALLEGMRDDQRLQLAQQLAVAAQLQVELDPLDDRGQPLLLQPRALRGEQAVRAHAPQRLTAPDTKRLLDPVPSDAAAHRPHAPDVPGRAPAASGRHRARQARTSSR